MEGLEVGSSNFPFFGFLFVLSSLPSKALGVPLPFPLADTPSDDGVWVCTPDSEFALTARGTAGDSAIISALGTDGGVSLPLLGRAFSFDEKRECVGVMQQSSKGVSNCFGSDEDRSGSCDPDRGKSQSVDCLPCNLKSAESGGRMQGLPPMPTTPSSGAGCQPSGVLNKAKSDSLVPGELSLKGGAWGTIGWKLEGWMLPPSCRTCFFTV
mmetsp:Transcript_21945/g.34384  ORF Transcript_21945/g.34384 Transcript_21945/m.34384 type:complete len:211 (-) Transcript_21945:536-1168(-)